MNLWILIAISIATLIFVGILCFRISKKSPGNKKMQEIAEAIQEGAMAFLMKEYKVLGFFVVAVVILLYFFINMQTAIAFFFGAMFSASAGFIGMKIATKANVRTTEAARKGLKDALKIAFSSGAVMGLTVVSLGLLGIVALYMIFKNPQIIYGFSFGASSIVLFAMVSKGMKMNTILNILRIIYRSRITWIFITIIIMYIASPYINQYLDRYVFHKEPCVTLATTHIFRVPNDNLINFTESDALAFKFPWSLNDGRELYILLDKTRNYSAELFLDDERISPWGIMLHFDNIYKNYSIKNYNCIFVFPYKQYSLSRQTLRVAISIPTESPDCKSCFEKTIFAMNYGNDEIKNFKVDVCVGGWIEGIEENPYFRKTNDKCVELRTEHFLPKDKLRGYFYGTDSWSIESFFAWDEKDGEFPEHLKIELMAIIIENCTY